MAHINYKGYDIERDHPQWKFYDEVMQDWVYLSCGSNLDDLKRYLDGLATKKEV